MPAYYESRVSLPLLALTVFWCTTSATTFQLLEVKTSRSRKGQTERAQNFYTSLVFKTITTMVAWQVSERALITTRSFTSRLPYFKLSRKLWPIQNHTQIVQKSSFSCRKRKKVAGSNSESSQVGFIVLSLSKWDKRIKTHKKVNSQHQ